MDGEWAEESESLKIRIRVPRETRISRKRPRKTDDNDDYDGIDYDEDDWSPSSKESEDVYLPKAASAVGGLSNYNRSDSTPTGDLLHDIFKDKEFSDMELKPDHAVRPMWVCPDKRIFLETYSPIYRHAYDFLIAISEPVARPPLMHEYQLTPYSLFAAVSVGLETEDIISVLDRLSKNQVPAPIKAFIRGCTLSYGKVKLVLQRNKYYIESPFPDILQKLLTDETIQNARYRAPDSLEGSSTSMHTEEDIDPETGFIRSGGASGAFAIAGGTGERGFEGRLVADDAAGGSLGSRLLEADEDRIDAVDQALHSFRIKNSHVEHVKRRCIELDYPTLEEYDFRNDTVNANLDIDLKPSTQIRPYQEKSLSKMFGNGRARSGIIVLPCGAGKTLVGVTATCTVKKSTLVLCTSSVAVEQWRHQYKLWSNADDRHICRFTSDTKEEFTTGEARIVISTYTMIAFGGRRAKESAKIMKELQSREWGLLIMDEVHVVPADMFRKVIYCTAAHCKLGLTATLVREDQKISDLNFLIGPKLYEANWLDLQRSGHIANVQCAEVWCPMTPEFYREYLNATPRRRKLLYITNPNKIRACEYLVRYHEERGDKIIVFSDNIFSLKICALRLGKPYIYGPTSQTERMRVLSQFQHNPALKTIFISKVGDNSIDLPEANVIIQISSHFGSRRQEAQRLGRILRPKARAESEFNAFFYSLVSQDTQEMFYSTKRQQFLIDQGYSFKIITHLPDMDSSDLSFSTREEQLELLTKVLATNESAAGEETLETDRDAIAVLPTPKARRITGSMQQLTGASGVKYFEYTSESGEVFRKRVTRHALFKKRFK